MGFAISRSKRSVIHPGHVPIDHRSHIDKRMGGIVVQAYIGGKEWQLAVNHVGLVTFVETRSRGGHCYTSRAIAFDPAASLEEQEVSRDALLECVRAMTKVLERTLRGLECTLFSDEATRRITQSQIKQIDMIRQDVEDA